MSDNYQVLDATANSVTIRSTDSAGVQIPHHIIESGTVTIGSSALPTGAATAANQTNGTQKVIIADATDTAAITARAITGVKGLCVNIGPTDPISDIPVVMPYDHHKLHEGEMFRCSVYYGALAGAFGTAVGNTAADYRDVKIIVPVINSPATNEVTRCPHLRLEVVASAGGTVELYEAPTFVTPAGGLTQIPAVPMERNGTYTSKTTVFVATTPSQNIIDDSGATAYAISTGTILYRGLLTAGTGKASNASDSSVEFVLKNNTSYGLRFRSAGTSNEVLIRLVWYEDLGV